MLSEERAKHDQEAKQHQKDLRWHKKHVQELSDTCAQLERELAATRLAATQRSADHDELERRARESEGLAAELTATAMERATQVRLLQQKIRQLEKVNSKICVALRVSWLGCR